MIHRLALITLLAILAKITTGGYTDDNHKNYIKSEEFANYQKSPYQQNYKGSYEKYYKGSYQQDYKGLYPQYNKDSYQNGYQSYQSNHGNHYGAPSSYNNQPYSTPYQQPYQQSKYYNNPYNYQKQQYYDILLKPYHEVNFVKPPYTRPFQEDYETFKKNSKDKEACFVDDFVCSRSSYSTFPYTPRKTNNFIPYCPLQNIKTKCTEDNYYYRTLDGTCNNLKYSWWGAAKTPYDRIAPSHQNTTETRPNARIVAKFFDETARRTRPFNDLYTFFGMFVGYDMAYTAVNNHVNCKDTNINDPSNCLYIALEVNDTLTPNDFIRINKAADIRKGSFTCDDLTENTPYNDATHFLDLHPLYGFDTTQNMALRTKVKGQLATSLVPGSNLPSVPVIKNESCQAMTRSRDCFNLGDPRGGEVSQLTSMHIMFLRYHNNIALKLDSLNQNWDDERIFQETRKIVIAVYQNIIYSEYLPYILGKDLMDLFDLVPQKKGYFNGYDDYVYPNSLVEAIGAAFRLHHKVGENIHLGTNFTIDKLSNSMNNDYQTYNNLDQVLDGLFGSDAYSKTGASLVNSLNNELNLDFTSENMTSSLGAINIERGRDLRLPSYYEMRKYAGLGDNYDNIEKDTYDELINLYGAGNIKNVDLFVGCLVEEESLGFELGPTCAYIIAKQFFKLKYGDRFYYENDFGDYVGFTLKQLDEIRKTSIATIACNSLELTDSFENGFLPQQNQFGVPNDPNYCSSIFQLNLELWETDYKTNYDYKQNYGY